MMIDLPHVQPRKNHFRYRRKVPAKLRNAIGKADIIIPLGKTEAEVVKRWPKAHAEAERRLSAKLPKQTPREDTEMELFRDASKQARKWGLDPAWNVEELEPEDDDFFDDDELLSCVKHVQAIKGQVPTGRQRPPRRYQRTGRDASSGVGPRGRCNSTGGDA